MLIKKICFFGAIFLATPLLMAQYKLSGTIKDSDNKEPLKNASIYFTDLKKNTTTDQNGSYFFENLKEGKYFVEISHSNYSTFLATIDVKNDTIANFELQKSAKEIAEVVVTAVSRASELKKIPVVIKSIDQSQINQNSSTNIIDGLKNIPGINQITTGAAISKPVIRGLGYNRVITLVNGIRQEGQQWGDEHGIEIDDYSVGKVEIVKGPGSLMYGSDGIAGVLNFISQKAPSDGKIENQLNTNYQSNNNLIANSFSNRGNKNGFVWEGRITNKMAGNYENKYDGKVYNSGFKENDGNLMLGINKNWGHSYFNFSTYNNTLNIVEGERDADGKFTYINGNGEEITATDTDYKGYKTGFPHQKINHLRFTSNNYFLLKSGTINADFAFQNNKRREFGDATNPNDTELYFDLNTFNYNVRYNLNQNINFRLSYATGFRAPQTFDEDLHVGVVGGNRVKVHLADGLKEEKSNSLSISADLYHNFGNVQTNLLVEGFYTKLNNVFSERYTNQIDNEGNTILERYNGSGAKVMGVNIEGKAAFSKLFQFQGGVTLQQSKYDKPTAWSKTAKEEKKMFRSPNTYGYFTATYTPVKDLSASLTGTYTGSMLVEHVAGSGTPVDIAVKTPDYFSANFKVAYDIHVYQQSVLQIYAGIQNITNAYQKDFDKGYNRDSNYIYGPSLPRSYYVGTKFSF